MGFWDFDWLGLGGGSSSDITGVGPVSNGDAYSGLINNNIGPYASGDAYGQALDASYLGTSGLTGLSQTSSIGGNTKPWYEGIAGQAALTGGVLGIGQLLKPPTFSAKDQSNLDFEHNQALAAANYQNALQLEGMKEKAALAAAGIAAGAAGKAAKAQKFSATLGLMGNAAQNTREGGNQTSQAFDRLAARLQAAALYRRGGGG